MPKVSIIIPVYNAEKYLETTLKSALGQTFTDIEIVCVDDGSTDRSAQILKRYQEKDPRVKVITQKNAGGSAARNTGLSKATGDYVMFLDADDIYAKDIIEHAYNRATVTDVDIVFYNFARFVGKPTKLAIVNKNTLIGDWGPLTKEEDGFEFFTNFAIITWNKLVKRSVIFENKLTFNTELSHNHDVDFSVRLMLAAKTFFWLDKVGYYYRGNSTGLTATKRSDPTNVLKILLDLNKTVFEKYPSVKESFNKYVTDMIVGTIIKYRHDSEKVKAIVEFSHDVVVPEVGLSSKQYESYSGIFKNVEANDYERIIKYLHSPKQKVYSAMRAGYDAAQRALALFTV